MSGDPRQEQAFVQQLKASGDPRALAQATQLQTLYHDQQMAELAADVYKSAERTGQPPTGWIRASEHPEALAAFGLNAEDIKHQMQPESSGFRAELYLPDAKVLGPGYEPVLAFKGSANSVMTSNGLRETSAEDFFANNFPQSVGLETDYYDRAMTLAAGLSSSGLNYELTGHSLAGGMASAAAAVTGNRATTWNAAGLHPATAERFVQQHGGSVYDASQLVKSYQVQGELLNAGIQDNIHGLSWIQRNELGNTLQEASQVLNQNPVARDLLKQALDKQVPVEAQGSVHAFIDKVADGNTNQMLRDLPLAAGQVQPLLAPMQPADANGQVLIARKQEMGLPELTLLAGPLLDVANATAVGARTGHAMGEAVAGAGHQADRALHAVGSGAQSLGEGAGHVAQKVTQFEGRVVQAGEHVVGAAAAHGRVLAGEAEAQLVSGAGKATHAVASAEAHVLRDASGVLGRYAPAWMNDAASRLEQSGQAVQQATQSAAAAARHDAQADASAIRADTHAAEARTGEAAQRLGDAQHRLLAGTGGMVDRGLGQLGTGVEKATANAPEAGRIIGGVTGLGSSISVELTTPANAGRLAGLALAASQAKAAGSEALARHGMTTVLPSLEHRIEGVEREARQTLQAARAQHPTTSVPAPSPTLADPAHPGHAMYNQAREGVYRIDAQMGRQPDQHSDQLAGALAATAKVQGMSRIDQVALGDNGAKAFAVEQVIPNALTRDAEVQTAQAVHQPLAQSTAAWDQAHLQQQAQAQSQQAPSQSQQQAAPAMAR